MRRPYMPHAIACCIALQRYIAGQHTRHRSTRILYTGTTFPLRERKSQTKEKVMTVAAAAARCIYRPYCCQARQQRHNRQSKPVASMRARPISNTRSADSLTGSETITDTPRNPQPPCDFSSSRHSTLLLHRPFEPQPSKAARWVCSSSAHPHRAPLPDAIAALPDRADGPQPRASASLRAYARSPRMRRASWMSLGMMVTRLAWIAHRLVSSNRPTR